MESLSAEGYRPCAARSRTGETEAPLLTLLSTSLSDAEAGRRAGPGMLASLTPAATVMQLKGISPLLTGDVLAALAHLDVGQLVGAYIPLAPETFNAGRIGLLPRDSGPCSGLRRSRILRSDNSGVLANNTLYTKKIRARGGFVLK